MTSLWRRTARPEPGRRESASLGSGSIIPAVSSPRAVLRLRELVAHTAYILAAQTLYWVAVGWRRALLRTTFIAVTGTHGKTTTKEMLAAILGSSWPTFRTASNENTGLPLTLNILRVRPWQRFAVVEIGVGAPGEMRRLARLVRPDVAVMLTVLRTHTKAFGDQERHAREKAVLLRALRPGGLAVINADDPLAAGMAEVVRCRVVRSGTCPGFDVWAEGATSRWPGRLEFDVRTRDGEFCHARTRLVGTHWCTSATAALATARALGVPLPDAVAALAAVEPFQGRMQPMLLPSGAVVLRDDYDGSIDAFEAGLRVLAEARAARRIAVIADASDYGSTVRRKRVGHLGRESARVADVVVFVGQAAEHGRRGALAAGVAPENVHAFRTLPEAANFLHDTLQCGDFVLLKGRVSDHLARVFFAQLGPVRCQLAQCEKRILCDECADLGIAPDQRNRAMIAPVERATSEGLGLPAS
jgi:UDP-N-acetylmuramoyl-tripeptide--D-alanyl-D-alanine ligase